MALKKTKYRPISRTQKIGETFEIINETLDTAVDELEGLRYSKMPVRLVTTLSLPAFTAAADVLEATANGALVVDGKEVAVNDRILVSQEYNPTTLPYNGIYDVKVAGSATAKWKLQRAVDAAIAEDFINGVMVLAVDGEKNKDLFFSLASDSVQAISAWADAATSPIGSVPLVFSEVTFGGGGIMGHPVVITELPPAGSRKYRLPYSGMYEMVWMDGILQVRGVHYNVADGVVSFSEAIKPAPVAGLNRVTASAALFIASSLKNAGGSFTTPSLVTVYRDPVDGRLYGEVPGAGDDELVWIDGSIIVRGADYVRQGNRIYLTPASVSELKNNYLGTTVFPADGTADVKLFDPADPEAYELVISGEKIPLLDTNAFRLNGVPGTEYVRKFQQGSVSHFADIPSLKAYSPTDLQKPASYTHGMLAIVANTGLYRFNADSVAEESAATGDGMAPLIIRPWASRNDLTTPAATGRWELIFGKKSVESFNADKLGTRPAADYVTKLSAGSITYPAGLAAITGTPEKNALALVDGGLFTDILRYLGPTNPVWESFNNLRVENANKLVVSGKGLGGLAKPGSFSIDSFKDSVAVRDENGVLWASPGKLGSTNTYQAHSVLVLEPKSDGSSEGIIPAGLLPFGGKKQELAGKVWAAERVRTVTAPDTSLQLLEVGTTGELQGRLTADLSLASLKTLFEVEPSASKLPPAALLYGTQPFRKVVNGKNITLTINSDGDLVIANSYEFVFNDIGYVKTSGNFSISGNLVFDNGFQTDKIFAKTKYTVGSTNNYGKIDFLVPGPIANSNLYSNIRANGVAANFIKPALSTETAIYFVDSTVDLLDQSAKDSKRINIFARQGNFSSSVKASSEVTASTYLDAGTFISATQYIKFGSEFHGKTGIVDGAPSGKYLTSNAETGKLQIRWLRIPSVDTSESSGAWTTRVEGDGGSLTRFFASDLILSLGGIVTKQVNAIDPNNGIEDGQYNVRFIADKPSVSSKRVRAVVYADTYFGRQQAIKNADIAEHVPNYPKDLAPADVAVMDDENSVSVKKHTGVQYDITVAGVVSTEPAIRLGSTPQEEKELAEKNIPESPIALAGRVPTKVTTKYIDEDGTVKRRPIKRGYLLVSSSIPGHAMAADPSDKNGKIPPGTVIGKAMQEWNPVEGEPQEGVIKVWVNLA